MLRSSRSGFLFCLLTLGCSPAAPTATPRSAERSAGDEEEPEPSDSLSVTGIRGTLSQEEIRRALEPKLPKFLRCVQQRRAELEPLAGEITFSFHVATNGSVVSVNASASSLGDRETERCMLQLAEAVLFPAPHGGEADFNWPLEIPTDEEVRPPVELSADVAREALAQQLSELASMCGGGQVIVTAYVDPEGQVLASGGAAPDIASPAQLDCITQGVRALRFPSPGSYLGKVSFSIP